MEAERVKTKKVSAADRIPEKTGRKKWSVLFLESLLKEATEREAESEKEKVLSEANAEIESMVSAAIDKMLVSAGADPLNDFLDKAEKED